MNWRLATIPLLGSLLLGLALTGCTVGPDFERPASPTATQYQQEGTPDLAVVPGEPAQGFAVGEKVSQSWWTLFRSSALDAVLKEAIAQNNTIAAARANLAAGQEIANAARGRLFPQVDFAASAERERLNFAAFGLPQPPATFNVFSVGPTVSYSLDVFGKNRRLIEQREAEAQIQAYQLSATYLSLTGNAVNHAILIASLDAQIKATNEIIASDRALVGLVQRSLQAGNSTELDLQTAQSQLATDETLLPPLRQQMAVARHALAVLVAKSPAEWSPPSFTLESLTLPSAVPVSLPSALVRQRPDILAAEAELHAASAAVGVATASLYPDITITGMFEQTATSATNIFTAGATGWSVLGGLTQPVFHGGALTAQKRAAEDNFNAARAGYQQTVLTSFAQVADLLDALQHDTELLDREKAALAAASRTVELTRRAYQAGDITLFQVTDAARQNQRARLGYIRAQAQRYSDTAQLFVAMGGGWWERPDLQSAANPENSRDRNTVAGH